VSRTRASWTVAEAVGGALVEAGTADLFGLLGSGNVTIAEAAGPVAAPTQGRYADRHR
jgi:hypothetical protein